MSRENWNSDYKLQSVAVRNMDTCPSKRKRVMKSFAWFPLSKHLFEYTFLLLVSDAQKKRFDLWLNYSCNISKKKILIIYNCIPQFGVSLNSSLMCYIKCFLGEKRQTAALTQIFFNWINFTIAMQPSIQTPTRARTFHALLNPIHCSSIDQCKASMSARIAHNYFCYHLFTIIIQTVRFQCFSHFTHECWFSIKPNVRTNFLQENNRKISI